MILLCGIPKDDPSLQVMDHLHLQGRDRDVNTGKPITLRTSEMNFTSKIQYVFWSFNHRALMRTELTRSIYWQVFCFYSDGFVR